MDFLLENQEHTHELAPSQDVMFNPESEGCTHRQVSVTSERVLKKDSPGLGPGLKLGRASSVAAGGQTEL